MDIRSLGRSAQLLKDDSLLQLGVTGNFRGTSFAVIGRLQMKYDGGHWSEWLISFSDGRRGWLGEAMGSTMVTFETPLDGSVPGSSNFEPGQSVQLNGKPFVVKNIDEAAPYALEGEIPREVRLGEETTLVDLSGNGRAFATLDFGDTPPTLYLGEYVDAGDLNLRGLKLTDGPLS